MNRLKGLKLKFDVADNPELSRAIQRRVFELGSAWNGNSNEVKISQALDQLYLGEYDNGKLTWRKNLQTKPYGKYKLATLDDLYHLPEQKARLVLPDGKDIELSDETFAAIQEAMK